ncbi:MAG: serine hydrolase [Candidatus Aminicenantes bacterium]
MSKNRFMKLFLHTVFLLAVFSFITSCKGNNDFDYEYQRPELLNDGWQVSTLENEGIDEDGIRDLMNLIHSDYDFMYSLLIVRNGKLVLEEYFGECSRGWLFPIQSSTKSFAAALIGIALDQGFISSVDEPIVTFFPEYLYLFDSTKETVTLRHVLMMAAGFDWNELYVPYSNPNNDNYIGNEASNYIEYALSKSVVDMPGTFWNYNSGCSIILGGIIKNTTSMPADEFAETYLFQPLGNIPYDWWIMNGDVVSTHGGLSLLARDMAKFGQLHLENGTWNGQRIISEQWVTESTSAHIPRTDVACYDDINSKYGYQWWLDTVNGHEVYYTSGLGGQFIFVISDLNLVVITTAETGSDPIFGQQHEQVRSLLGEYILPIVK